MRRALVVAALVCLPGRILAADDTDAEKLWSKKNTRALQDAQIFAGRYSQAYGVPVDPQALIKFTAGMPVLPADAKPEQIQQWQRQVDAKLAGASEAELAFTHDWQSSILQLNHTTWDELYSPNGREPRIQTSEVGGRFTGTPASAPNDAPTSAPSQGDPASRAGTQPPREVPAGAYVSYKAAVDRLAKRPDDPAALVDAAEVEQARGNAPVAFQELRRAVSAGDMSPRTLTLYGRAAHEVGDDALAAEAGRRAYAQDPSDKAALALVRLAGSHVGAAALPAGAKDLGFPQAGGPGGDSAPSATAGRGRGPAAGTAAAAAGGARAHAAPRAEALAREAASALRLGDAEKARAQAAQAAAQDPGNAGALFYLATADLRLGLTEAALADSERLLAAAPGSAAGYLSRAAALTRLGRWREAEADARRAVALEPRNPTAYFGLAVALAGEGDRAGVGRALEEAARLDPAFEPKRRQFLQLAQDADLKLLFTDAMAAGPPGQAPARAPGSGGRRLAWPAAAAAGGGLLLLAAAWAARRRRGDTPRPAGRGAPAERYQVVRELGAGGMGVVHEALDRSLGRRVALKRIRPELREDADLRRRFVTEARLVAALRHPGIVSIYSVEEDSADAFLVFEFVAGRTLAARLQEGPLPFPEARRVVGAAAAAVLHAHEHRIIHRDLKPSNIMLADDGSVKVMDFGVARQSKEAHSRLSMTNTVAGTPPYMAPEQDQGLARPESDVFALGVVLYECLSGLLPFEGSGAAMALSKAKGAHQPLSRRTAQPLPPGLDAVMARALHPDPDQRYRTPAQLMAALDALPALAAS